MKRSDYIAAGYFLSRHTGALDCTGIELRRTTLASDHAQREFFPDAWAISWCSEDRSKRVERAEVFGIAEHDLDRIIAWADRGFGESFGAWSVFFSLDEARAAARSMLGGAAGLELWGVGLHRDLVSAYCDATKPPPATPGFAPVGASGVHTATCVHTRPLAEGGTALGHELLIEDFGCAFNSPESRHLDEKALYGAAGVEPNAHGLIDDYEDALSCCRHLDARAAETPHRITGWRPWLIVQYPLA
jgi:hypothetical protein